MTRQDSLPVSREWVGPLIAMCIVLVTVVLVVAFPASPWVWVLALGVIIYAFFLYFSPHNFYRRIVRSLLVIGAVSGSLPAIDAQFAWTQSLSNSTGAFWTIGSILLESSPRIAIVAFLGAIVFGCIDYLSRRPAPTNRAVAIAIGRGATAVAQSHEAAASQSLSSGIGRILDIDTLLREVENALLGRDLQLAEARSEYLHRAIADSSKQLLAEISIRSYDALVRVQLELALQADSTTSAGVHVAKAREYIAAARHGRESTDERLANIEALSAFAEVVFGAQSEQGQALEYLSRQGHSLGRALHIRALLKLKMLAEAADAAKSQAPDDITCDAAVRALVCGGQEATAVSTLAWVRDRLSGVPAQRSAIAFAEALLTAAFPDNAPVSPNDLSAGQSRALTKAVDVLNPVIQQVQGAGRITSRLEMLAVLYMLRITVLGQDQQEVAVLARLLATFAPVQLDLARLALEGAIQCDTDLPRRLQLERPDSFEAQLLAVLLTDECLQKPADALQKAMALMPSATTVEFRDELAKAILQIAQHSGKTDVEKAKMAARELLPKNDCTLDLFEAIEAVRDGQSEVARKIVDAHRDTTDPFWLQVQAQVLLAEEKTDEALEAFRAAMEQNPHHRFLATVSGVAQAVGRPRFAIECLKQIVDKQPSNYDAVRQLAMLQLGQREYDAAIAMFERLESADAATSGDQLNHAYALVITRRLEEARDLYEELCSQPEPPLIAIVARSQVLHAMGKAKKGLELLSAVKEGHWDDYRFVGAYMQIAYAAGDDQAANEAMVALKKLQDEGRTDSVILEPKTLDEVLEEFRKRQSLERDLVQHVVRGVLPWLTVDGLLGRGPSWAWAIRTQPLAWQREDLIVRTQYSIYSTNGLGIRDVDGTKVLAPLEAADGAAVLDMTAIMTLYKLGLLDETLSLFDSVCMPVAYAEAATDESTQLLEHQASRRKVAETLRKILETGQIQVVNPAIGTVLPTLNEYATDSEAVVRIVDVIELMHRDGILPDGVAAELKEEFRRPDNEPRHELVRGEAIVVELMTLERLVDRKLIENAMSILVLKLSDVHRERLHAELHGFETQEALREWQAALWDWIQDDGRIQQQPASMPEGLGSRSDAWRLGLASAFLAIELKRQLIADDRVVQSLVLNEACTPRLSACGSDAIVRKLRQEGILSDHDAAKAILQLMKWRYRFVLPEAWFLKTLADEFAGSLPGINLQAVAVYAHDCMRDAGLLSGLEPTDPPGTVADRVYKHWVCMIAEFLAAVWVDKSLYDSERAKNLTHWTLGVLLPGVPRNLMPNVFRLAAMTESLLLGSFMLALSVSDDYDRCSEATKTVASELGLDDERARQLEMNIINDL